MSTLVQELRRFVGQRLTANFTTTVVAATSTALSFSILPGEVWAIDYQLTAQCSANGGVKYAIACPVGATIEGWIYSSTNAILTMSYQRIVAIGVLNATALHTVTALPAPDIIRVLVTNGANSGAVALQAASVTAGQTTTVFAGSFMRAQRVA